MVFAYGYDHGEDIGVFQALYVLPLPKNSGTCYVTKEYAMGTVLQKKIN